jgi:hypothetical protein
MTAARAPHRALVLVVALAILGPTLGIGSAGPAAAGDVGPLSDSFSMFEVQVTGTYQPIPLRLGCNQGGAAIFWYGKGSAPDALWTNVIGHTNGTVTHVDRRASVGGVYKPFADDFDGNGCTDIFWYAPGPAPDYVWWYGADLAVTSTRVTVNGSYIPIVGAFDGLADYATDIFWYAPGATARESIWTGSASKRFTARPAPQVVGTYRPSVYGDEDILWHAPGGAQDWWWSQVRYTRSTPVSSHRITMNESYQTYSVNGRPFLYRSDGDDRAVFGFEGTSLTTTVGEVPGGPHLVGATQESPVIVFHVPGPGTDHIWIRG